MNISYFFTVKKAMSARRKVLLASTALLMLSLVVIPVFADPLTTNAKVGDVYIVKTIEGKVVTVPASVELRCQITEFHRDMVLFKVIWGEIVIDDREYTVLREWWRGVYNKNSNEGYYQGWAVDDAGHRAYFILHTLDKRPTQEGCFMEMNGVFRDPCGVYWRLDLITYRYKLN